MFRSIAQMVIITMRPTKLHMGLRRNRERIAMLVWPLTIHVGQGASRSIRILWCFGLFGSRDESLQTRLNPGVLGIAGKVGPLHGIVPVVVEFLGASLSIADVAITPIVDAVETGGATVGQGWMVPLDVRIAE